MNYNCFGKFPGARCAVVMFFFLVSVKCTKTHIYYAMKNCNGDTGYLRSYIINIVDHYKVCLLLYTDLIAGQVQSNNRNCSLYVPILPRVIILSVMRSPVVNKRAMFAAKSP